MGSGCVAEHQKIRVPYFFIGPSESSGVERTLRRKRNFSLIFSEFRGNCEVHEKMSRMELLWYFVLFTKDIFTFVENVKFLNHPGKNKN